MVKDYGTGILSVSETQEVIEEKIEEKIRYLDSLESLISDFESEASVWSERADDGRITTGMTIATIDTLRDILENIEGAMLDVLEIQKDLDDLKSGDYTVDYQEYGVEE